MYFKNLRPRGPASKIIAPMCAEIYFSANRLRLLRAQRQQNSPVGSRSRSIRPGLPSAPAASTPTGVDRQRGYKTPLTRALWRLVQAAVNKPGDALSSTDMGVLNSSPVITAIHGPYLVLAPIILATCSNTLGVNSITSRQTR